VVSVSAAAAAERPAAEQALQGWLPQG